MPPPLPRIAASLCAVAPLSFWFFCFTLYWPYRHLNEAGSYFDERIDIIGSTDGSATLHVEPWQAAASQSVYRPCIVNEASAGRVGRMAGPGPGLKVVNSHQEHA